MSSNVLTASDITTSVFTDTVSHDTAVSVRGLAKSYSIAKNAEKHSTMGEALMHKLKNPLAKPERETFWALNDVSFDIQKGDVVGIIGRNGAGKSTLLKILSRITEPTRGRIDLYGRVGSLLEVGTGFHPELTGRENVFLNGAILGMQKSEIARQFDAIVDFSGTEQFLDTPVKRYSSGMYVRLAFAVAAHLNPEILIVDEVLAVGDTEFQKKCLGKMREVAAGGRTVLFVSHNMAAIKNLCNSAILLKKGHVELQDTTENVINRYVSGGATGSSDLIFDESENPSSNAIFTRAWVTDINDEIVSDVDVTKPFYIGMEILCRQSVSGVELSAIFHNSETHPLFMCSFSDQSDSYFDFTPGTYTFKIKVPGHLLAPDQYSVTLIAHRPMIETLDRHDGTLAFSVVETGSKLATYQAKFGNMLVQFPWEYTANKSFR